MKHLGWMSAALVSLAACASAEDAPRGSGSSFGQVRMPIINGTADTTHPAVVFLGLVDDLQNPTQGAGCTGTIVKVDADAGIGWVLTAAHCVDDLYVAAVIQGNDYDSQNVISYNVLDAVPHPEWQSSYFDLGIVRIGGVSADTPTMPIISGSDGLSVGDTVTTIGYGQTENENQENTVRRKTSARIGNLETREIHYSFDGTGSCHGDSGGPSVVVRNGVETVVGVVSHGLTELDCYGDGADTRVSAGLAFINQQLSDTSGQSGSCDSCQQSAYSGTRVCAGYSQDCVDDTDCNALLECFDRCTSDSCYANCRDQHPEGFGPYLKAAACGCNEACTDQCAGDDSCANVPKCGIAFQPDACTTCIESSCCDELYEAGTDKQGNVCLNSDNATGCDSNPHLQALRSCVSDKCADACGDESPVGSSGGSSSGGGGERSDEESSSSGGGGIASGDKDEGGCNVGGSSGPGGASLLGVLALVGLRRRNRARS